ncbi:MAG: hypothetical protein KatS3mg082_1556 [Nitrospiraceae bacterium]|nr:MAG: hypothetical protein KatS3mg082_1556 [Nitrospiraceae bacterium]
MPSVLVVDDEDQIRSLIPTDAGRGRLRSARSPRREGRSAPIPPLSDRPRDHGHSDAGSGRAGEHHRAPSGVSVCQDHRHHRRERHDRDSEPSRRRANVGGQEGRCTNRSTCRRCSKRLEPNSRINDPLSGSALRSCRFPPRRPEPAVDFAPRSLPHCSGIQRGAGNKRLRAFAPFQTERLTTRHPSEMWTLRLNALFGSLVVAVGFGLIWSELPLAWTAALALAAAGFLLWRGRTIGEIWAWSTLLLGFESAAWPIVTMIQIRSVTTEPTNEQLGSDVDGDPLRALLVHLLDHFLLRTVQGERELAAVTAVRSLTNPEIAGPPSRLSRRGLVLHKASTGSTSTSNFRSFDVLSSSTRSSVAPTRARANSRSVDFTSRCQRYRPRTLATGAGTGPNTPTPSVSRRMHAGPSAGDRTIAP